MAAHGTKLNKWLMAKETMFDILEPGVKTPFSSSSFVLNSCIAKCVTPFLSKSRFPTCKTRKLTLRST